MSHSSLPHLCSPAALLAFGATCLLTLTPGVARAAGPLANGAPTEFCRSTLARLVEVAESLGYDIALEGSGFSATSDANDLRCVCSEGLVTIELVEPDASVSVNFSQEGAVFGLEIAGQFPELGSIQHTSLLDGTAERSSGSLTFAAETADAAALVEFGLEGEILTDDGDPSLVNERFAPALAGSIAWKDAHALMFALADMPEPGLDVAMTVAVPSPRWWGVKKSILGQAFACGGAAITCTAAAAGFVPAAGSCVNAAGGCALAVACSFVSCLD